VRWLTGCADQRSRGEVSGPTWRDQSISRSWEHDHREASAPCAGHIREA
jgi:hypothetical protein